MEKGGRLDSPLRLDLGIVRAEPSEKIVREILFAGMRANSYGEERSASLRKLISSELRVPCENISVGNGSLEILSSIARAFILKGESSVTIPVPTFYGYKEFSGKRGAKITLIDSSGSGGKFETDFSLLRELSKKSDLTFLCSPNNPTGEVFSEKEIGLLCSGSGGLVVLDQALLDPPTEEGISLSEKFGNLVLVRTCSKTRALAGIRVGFSVSEASLAEKIAGKLLPFGLNSVSQRAAIASIRDREFQASLKKLRKVIDYVGTKRCILTSDYGQVKSPDPVSGIFSFARRLGLGGTSFRKLSLENPMKLIKGGNV